MSRKGSLYMPEENKKFVANLDVDIKEYLAISRTIGIKCENVDSSSGEYYDEEYDNEDNISVTYD